MKKITILDLKKMKDEGDKISMLTAYDFRTSLMLDECGVDILLVGDSVGNVVMGLENTLPVTVDDMLYHTKAVVRGRKFALVVADMPFMSYQVSIDEARRNAGILIKEGGAEAVKVEGGENVESVMKALTDIDIPVMGHIGLTPQSVHRMGGYKVQGKEEQQQEKLMADALDLTPEAFEAAREDGSLRDLLANTNRCRNPARKGTGQWRRLRNTRNEPDRRTQLPRQYDYRPLHRSHHAAPAVAVGKSRFLQPFVPVPGESHQSGAGPYPAHHTLDWQAGYGISGCHVAAGTYTTGHHQPIEPGRLRPAIHVVIRA